MRPAFTTGLRDPTASLRYLVLLCVVVALIWIIPLGLLTRIAMTDLGDLLPTARAADTPDAQTHSLFFVFAAP